MGDDVPAELSLREAARSLGISLAHLSQLLDDGVLPYEGSGKTRRVRVEHVLALKQEDAARREAARRLTEEAQNLGLDY